MKLVLSVAALGLVAGGATAVATQSSCTTTATHVTQLAAAPVTTCAQGAPVAECLAPVAAEPQSDKVAARAAELEALAGGEPAAAPQAHAHAGAHGAAPGAAPAPSAGQRRVFKYEGGRLTPLEPDSQALPAAPCEPCEPCEPAAPRAPHAPAAPAPRAKLKVKGGVGAAPSPIAPQQRLEIERALAEAQREQQRAMAQVHEELARAQREVQREVERAERASRADVARAIELAQSEARRAGEQAREQVREAREFAQAEARSTQEARRMAQRRAQAEEERAAQSQRSAKRSASTAAGRGPSSATSPRERELEQRVAELEARLAELESRRAPPPVPPVPPAAPSAPRPGAAHGHAFPGGQVWSTAPQGGATFHLDTAPQGATIRMRATTGDDAECSPSRVRVFRLGPGQGTVVIEGGEGPDAVELSDEELELFVPGAETTAWAEDFAEDMADWSEEFAEDLAEWGEDFAEDLEGFADEAAGDCCAEPCEEPCERDGEDAVEAECDERDACEVGLRAGQLLGSTSGIEEQARVSVQALESLFGSAPRATGMSGRTVAGFTPAVQGFGLPTDGLRGAVSEMRAEVEGLRELLAELRREVEARKREELR